MSSALWLLTDGVLMDLQESREVLLRLKRMAGFESQDFDSQVTRCRNTGTHSCCTNTTALMQPLVAAYVQHSIKAQYAVSVLHSHLVCQRAYDHVLPGK